MGGQDAYEVLGIDRNSSEDEIKQAYREKVKRYHPDACDKENAEELFKRVKNAYEALQSGGEVSETGSGSGQGKKTKRTRNKSERQTERKQAEQQSSSGKQRSDNGEHGRATRSDESEDERRRPDSQRDRSRGNAGFDADPSQWNTDSDDAPDDFEVTQRFDEWLLGRRKDSHEDEEGGWFVFKEFETAPHVDEKEFMFLAGDGAMTKEATYFETSDTAEEAYRSAFGERGEKHENEAEETGRRRYPPKGESYTHVSREEEGSADRGRWIEKRKKTDLDTLWSLYYQDESRGDGRRWAVVASVVGDNRFINNDGEYQETGFWFKGRKEAEGAHRRYMEKMSSVGEEEGQPTPEKKADPSQEEQSVSGSMVSALGDVLGRVLNRARSSVENLSPRGLLLLPVKLVLGLVFSPFLVILKIFSVFGAGRLFGALAVTVVGPLTLLVMHLIMPPIVIRSSVVGGMSITESFIWISVPALIIAVVLQVLYERSDIDFFQY